MFSNLWSSSFARMAATRPSIMSEGATMSAPARAWERACSARIAKRGVVGDFTVFDHAAVAVVGVFAEADVGDDDEI